MTEHPQPKSLPVNEISDHRLARMLAHPIRVQVLSALEVLGTASPKQIAKHTGVPLEKLSYHVRELARHGLIEEVERRAARGAIEHLYRTVGRPWLTAEAYYNLPRPAREAVVGAALDNIGRIIEAAFHQGCLDRPETISVRLPLFVDEDGFKELSELLADTMKQMEEVAVRAGERVRAGAEPVPATGVFMLFDTPDMSRAELPDLRVPQTVPRLTQGEA